MSFRTDAVLDFGDARSGVGESSVLMSVVGIGVKLECWIRSTGRAMMAQVTRQTFCRKILALHCMVFGNTINRKCERAWSCITHDPGTSPLRHYRRTCRAVSGPSSVLQLPAA